MQGRIRWTYCIIMINFLKRYRMVLGLFIKYQFHNLPCVCGPCFLSHSSSLSVSHDPQNVTSLQEPDFDAANVNTLRKSNYTPTLPKWALVNKPKYSFTAFMKLISYESQRKIAVLFLATDTLYNLPNRERIDITPGGI